MMIILLTAFITKYTMLSSDISVYLTSGTKDPFIIKILILIFLKSARIKKDQNGINQGNNTQSTYNDASKLLIKSIFPQKIIQPHHHQHINKNPGDISSN
jgi:hypothetical protein